MRYLLAMFGLLFGVAAAVHVAQGGDANMSIPVVTEVNSIQYVTIDAPTPRGRGYQHGAALKSTIHLGIEKWKHWIVTAVGEKEPDIEIAEFVQNTDFLDGIRKHTPSLYEELKGIADGADVDFNTLYAYQMFDEFLKYVEKKYRLVHCSGFGVYARPGFHNIIGQNNDLPPYYDGTHTVLNIIYPNGHRVLVFTWAGLLAQNGVNNKNLGVVMNIVPTKEGTENGVPMPYIIRAVLEKNNVDEALKFIESLGGSAAPMNFILGDDSEVLTVENTAEGTKVYRNLEGENWVAHTNHHLDADVSIMEPGAVVNTVERLDLLKTMLTGKSQSIDVEAAKQIFRTKPILKNHQTSPDFLTMESIVIDLNPGNPTIHVSPGPPDSNTYTKFDFDQKIQNSSVGK